MKVLLSILKNDIKLVIYDWKTLIFIFLMPVLLILYFSYAVYPAMNRDISIEPFDIALVDYENSIQSRILSEQLKDIKLIKKMHITSEDNARKLIMQNKISAAIIIPEGFTASVNVGENKSIKVLGNAKKELQSQLIKNLISGAANIVSSGQGLMYSYYHFVKAAGAQDDELNEEFHELAQNVIIKSLGRKEVISDISTYPESNLTPAEYYTASLFAIFLMFACMPLSKMLIIERALGITKRLATTSARGFKTILSKLIVSLLISLIQKLIIVFATSSIVQNYWGASKISIIGVFASGVFCVSAWSVFISVISKTLRTAEILSNLGILLMAVLGGSIYPLAKMSGFLKPISALTINRWLQEGFVKIFSGDKSPDILPQILPLILIGTFFIFISVILNRLRKTW